MKRTYIFCILFFAASFAGIKAYDEITPGVAWNDTGGARISAHGGQVVYHNGAYYWIGENKPNDKSTGVSCYKSTDLYNWQKLPSTARCASIPKTTKFLRNGCCSCKQTAHTKSKATTKKSIFALTGTVHLPVRVSI
jgi:hypothetical protein